MAIDTNRTGYNAYLRKGLDSSVCRNEHSLHYTRHEQELTNAHAQET